METEPRALEVLEGIEIRRGQIFEFQKRVVK
jgi:hypothetical protein